MCHRVNLIEDLLSQGIGFKSNCDGAIDATSASGELILNIFSALAQFERRLIQERTKSGLAVALARGRKGGRKPLPPDTPRVLLAKKQHRDKSIGIDQICETLHISRSTFDRYVQMSDPSILRKQGDVSKTATGDTVSHQFREQSI